jgi:hypothetical protein
MTREIPGLASGDRPSKRRHARSAQNDFIRPSSWRPQPISTIWGLGFDIEMMFQRSVGRPDVRHPANTIGDMRKLLLGYRDNMRVEIESGVAVTAKTVGDLRALSTWPEGLVLDIHVDLDPRLSVVRVERAS